MGTLASIATFDKDFKRERAKIFNSTNRTAIQDLKDGTFSLVNSLKSAVTGIVTQPVKGGKEEGAKGVVKVY